MSSYLRSAAAGAAAATSGGCSSRSTGRSCATTTRTWPCSARPSRAAAGWRPLGFALHAANGAAFGLAYEASAGVCGIDKRRLALGLALAEHVALYPLSYLVDRHHPARGEPGVPPLLDPRAFAQATWRHAVFGAALGRLAAG